MCHFKGLCVCVFASVSIIEWPSAGLLTHTLLSQIVRMFSSRPFPPEVRQAEQQDDLRVKCSKSSFHTFPSASRINPIFVNGGCHFSKSPRFLPQKRCLVFVELITIERSSLAVCLFRTLPKWFESQVIFLLCFMCIRFIFVITKWNLCILRKS